MTFCLYRERCREIVPLASAASRNHILQRARNGPAVKRAFERRIRGLATLDDNLGEGTEIETCSDQTAMADGAASDIRTIRLVEAFGARGIAGLARQCGQRDEENVNPARRRLMLK